ncbi:phage tail-collar fiber domain-containing protein [Shewanella sp.]|uniref:phage tail-collar fiber domain-containing protein n=1 Tax=Shewanella sp. TaxID=50422 RepID=UPI0040470D19
MAQVITIAGERLFALKAQNNEQLDIDTFIFANVPGQDPNATIDRNEGLPPVAQRVHQQIVQQVGRINDNVVVYSTVLDSVTGPFDFNWVGLYSSANQTLIAVSHIPNVSKTITAPGTAGNTLNRNFGIEYSGIADLAGITVQPETWQLDFTARLSGMDELTRQLAADMNGKDWFIEDGFKVVPRSTTNTFKVTPGAGYVSGLRVELNQDHILTLQSYPQFVYVDAWFDGDASSQWKPKTAFTVTNGEMDDYIDVNGKQHYVFKLARITAADVVDDMRVVGTNTKSDLRYNLIAKDHADLAAGLLLDGTRLSLEDGKRYIVQTVQPASKYLITQTPNLLPMPITIVDTNFSAQRLSEVNGAISFVFDDGAAASKNTLIPLAKSLGMKACLALYYSGMAASYDSVTLKDASDYIVANGGEILSHSMNSEKLDASTDSDYGNSMLYTSAETFGQYGFPTNGFVAPNSVLDSKFRKTLVDTYDFAFVRSVATTSPYASINFTWDDRYNLVRVSLESISTAHAKTLIDAAAEAGALVCFYTHTDTGNLTELFNYAMGKGLDNITPSQWLGQLIQLQKNHGINTTENFFDNSKMQELVQGDGPVNLSLSLSNISNGSYVLKSSENGNVIDFSSGVDTLAEQYISFAQNWFTGPLKALTPICFSLYASSLLASNTRLILTISLKDSSGNTIRSVSKSQLISGGRQRPFIAETFIPNDEASHIVVEGKIVAENDGPIRLIMDSPQIEKSGKPTAYKKTGIVVRYFSTSRVTTAQMIAPNTDTEVVFNQDFEGDKVLYKTSVGKFAPIDNRVYRVEVHAGLKSLVTGDIVEIILLVNGARYKRQQFTAADGDNIFGASFSIRGDGRSYSIAMRHNNDSSKQVTTYSDAILTISAR